MLPLLFALLQQSAAPQQPAAAPSPVARIALTPARPVVTAGDTLRIRAQALDANGQPVPNALIRYQSAGAFFEASVDSAGLVTSGSTGTFPISVVAVVPGAAPKVQRVEVVMVPGAAARIAVDAGSARMVVGQSVRARAGVFSAAGDERQGDRVTWRSSAPAVARVDSDGMITAVAPGSATITATTGSASGTTSLTVLRGAIASLALTPSRAEARTGDVVRFTPAAKDAAGRAITGLQPTWSFSPGHGMIEQDGAFVGYEAGDYVVTASFGTRSASAVVRLAERDVRRPLQVVGRLARSRFTTEEVWVHPNGRYAYLGSGGGGDVLYAIDIANPAKPVVTDSVVVNARRINDVMSDPDGKFIVFTREGASDRKNGIVIATIEDPAHPKVIAEFTEGVNAGVHSAFVYRQPRHGTHVYLTNDGTGALHIIDVNDPSKPKEVARWKTEGRPEAGRTLHDVDVQDGLLYASYWNDGLVILDVGNGVKGGSPSNPQLVSQFKYDLNALYKDVEATGGPGFIRGTHTAWRHKNYVFIADEVFPASGVKGAPQGSAAAGRAYGRLQVVDISDMAKPKSVAWYEPENGGVHNIWIAGDTLYMGAYNGGFRAFDVSGELRGDLRAQQREIGHLNTADMDGFVKNTAMTWGVVVKNGLAYVNDMYNGLWIVKIEPKPPVVP
jgi:hypothetical protein